jgi:hypothetical protein
VTDSASASTGFQSSRQAKLASAKARLDRAVERLDRAVAARQQHEKSERERYEADIAALKEASVAVGGRLDSAIGRLRKVLEA